MQRSAAQVMFRFLPGAVFAHEDEFIASVHHVIGETVHDVNRKVLLEELASELDRWQPDQVGIPSPAQFPDEFTVIEPKLVSWDVYPLTFECSNPNCGRIRQWYRQDTLVNETAGAGSLRCLECKSKMRQLRYLTAHECGVLDPLFTPSCANCRTKEHVYLEDLGSFRSSTWKCRRCGGVVQSTRFTPCNCGRYAKGKAIAYRRSFTARDSRLWYPQSLTIINLSSQTYDNFQQHPQRGAAALASFLGDEKNIATSLTKLDSPGTERLTQEDWETMETSLRAAGLDEDTIAAVRDQKAPAQHGVLASLNGADDLILEHLSQRTFVERAGLFDDHIIDDRTSLSALMATSDPVISATAGNSFSKLNEIGLEDISVTQQFPIVLASYGYTRVRRDAGDADLRGYAMRNQYRGKNPIFAVPARTEALIVSMSALSVVSFLDHEGMWDSPLPSDERTAKLALLRVFAEYPEADDGVAGTARRLVHSLSHSLLRALDDGESGFGESSLAEWIVPDALTTVIYVTGYSDFTLGAFDTVLRNRVTPWTERAVREVTTCDNDPLCGQQRPHAACDRCLHLSFGCKTWNNHLDRKLLRRFWRFTLQQAQP